MILVRNDLCNSLGRRLTISLSLQYLDPTHGTDTFLVGALLAVVGANLMHFLLKIHFSLLRCKIKVNLLYIFYTSETLSS